MPVSQTQPGINLNFLSPKRAGSFDPVGAMEHLTLTGIAVEVEAA